jgi:hypothetical protein
VDYWRPARLFEDLPVCIIAGGETFSAAQARLIGMARAKGHVRVIAINDAVYPCWFADIAYACDAAWWREHGPLPGFAGLRVTLEKPVFDGILRLNNTGPNGFDAIPGNIRSNGNGGYQALHLAAHLGASRAILVAFDMRGEHWFGSHPPMLDRRVKDWSTRIAGFAEIAPILARRGMDVVNVSPNSMISTFRRSDLETELRALENADAQRAKA